MNTLTPGGKEIPGFDREKFRIFLENKKIHHPQMGLVPLIHYWNKISPEAQSFLLKRFFSYKENLKNLSEKNPQWGKNQIKRQAGQGIFWNEYGVLHEPSFKFAQALISSLSKFFENERENQKEKNKKELYSSLTQEGNVWMTPEGDIIPKTDRDAYLKKEAEQGSEETELPIQEPSSQDEDEAEQTKNPDFIEGTRMRKDEEDILRITKSGNILPPKQNDFVDDNEIDEEESFHQEERKESRPTAVPPPNYENPLKQSFEHHEYDGFGPGAKRLVRPEERHMLDVDDEGNVIAPTYSTNMTKTYFSGEEERRRLDQEKDTTDEKEKTD